MEVIIIVWFYSNAVKSYNDLCIPLKKLTTDLLVTKTLIKYNCNNLEENDEEEKEQINIEFIMQKTGLEIMKMLLTLNDRKARKRRGSH